MPLDTAINNIGEYYAAHYLEAQFAKDIADPLKAWRDLTKEEVGDHALVSIWKIRGCGS